ncbi:MAG: peptide chain release factor N(5)-glutamine methyltransferase [Clostridia bacterium]|nr:peptide chain release factor N(5)-glutamine methyltransferase [Clostridia bacterium]
MEKSCSKKRTQIGGQALLEGVMMRGKSSMAMCVRDGDGIIRTETKRLTPPEKKPWYVKLPIVRGCVSFVSSLIFGTECLMRSGEVFGDDAEPGKFEKWLAKTFKLDIMKVVMAVSVVLALVLAVGLFVLLPQYSRMGLEWIFNHEFSPIAKNLIEGALRIVIFLCYILLCLLVPDVKRTFMYHGAEHKTISCYEEGLELTPENAQKCTRIHDRCGTSFIFLVMIIGILIFSLFEGILGAYSIEIDGIIRVLIKIAMLPLIAGLSYEALKLLAKTKSPIVAPLKAPGLLLQRLTTKEPTLEMIEVAISAFKEVLIMDEDPTVPTQNFVLQTPAKKVTEAVISTLKDAGIEEVSDAEWIVSLCANIPRDAVYSDDMVSAKSIDKISEIVEERKTGKPLWYCFKSAQFLDYELKVDERVLIPRPETEELVVNALKVIDENSVVLDLCTGSGAIAIAVKKRANCTVFASDISLDALSLAMENAQTNQAEIEFIHSDLFKNIGGKKFNVIISNPPYIKSEDITSLDREVKDFEPVLALDGGSDGLEYYKKIACFAGDYIAENGYLFLECGINQASAVAEMFKNSKSVEIIKDIFGVERIVKVVY